MFPIEVFQSTVNKLASILDRLEIPFHLVGGITGIAYGEPRMTQDIDIVVDNDRLAEAVDRFLKEIEQSNFLYTADEIRSAVASGDLFQLFDRNESLKLDIYTQGQIPGELSRSKHAEVFAAGEMLPLASREDTILSKLVWIDKGSHKNRRDLRFLYRNTDESQRAFIAEMAEEFGLTALLAEVLAEPDEIR